MDKPNQIKFTIDENQYEGLKLLANINRLSISNYCQFIVSSFVESIDISKLNDASKSRLNQSNPNLNLKLLK